MIPFSDAQVQAVFDSFPKEIRDCALALRDLVFSTAEKLNLDHDITETLKCGEPSYLCKSGSTIRINWKEDDPEHYRLLYHCQSKLVPTFRRLYASSFEFEGNRAIRFSLGEDPDLEKLGHCIEMALQYQSLKNLPDLGQVARP